MLPTLIRITFLASQAAQMPLFGYSKKSKARAPPPGPINFQHSAHVEFDMDRGVLKGLPPEMAKMIDLSKME